MSNISRLSDHGENQPGASSDDTESIRDFTFGAVRLDYQINDMLSVFGAFDIGRGITDSDDDDVDVQQIKIGASYQVSDGIDMFLELRRVDVDQFDPSSVFDSEQIDIDVISFGINYEFKKSAYRQAKKMPIRSDILDWQAATEAGLE